MMTDKQRRAARYLAFDALKGLKEEVKRFDDNLFKMDLPILSDEKKDEMDIILFNCYSYNKIINIYYYEDGQIISYSGVIKKIDLINRKIIFFPKKCFELEKIVNVISCD